MAYTDIKHKIDLLRKQIASHGKLTPEQLKKINYKFRLEWNYNSNSMEGNTLTIEETRSVMVGNIMVDKKPYKDIAEMKGHDEVISDILKIGKGELRLSEARIKQIHEAIMYEETEEEKSKIGKWKNKNNYIYNYKGERYDFVDSEVVPDKIHDLLNHTNAAIDAIENKSKNAPHPLDVAFNFHLEYVKIHPFYDGNGRTARILTNLILIALGYPPFWITEPQRAPYSNYLGDIQGYGGDPNLFNNFLAELVLRSQQLIVDVIEGRDIEADDDLSKEIALLKRQLEGENFTKSPKNIYEIFTFSKKNIWDPLNQMLQQFDDLFSDSKTKHYVNYLEELIHRNTIHSMFQTSTKPDTIKIFGHDIYGEDIFEIKWQQVKYGLKKGNKSTEYKIKFILNFNPSVYTLKITLNKEYELQEEFAYNQFPQEKTIKEFIKDVGKTIVNCIKNDIEER